MSGRLDYELLDDDDPFEVDTGNRPHLAKHFPFTDEDLLDIWAGDVIFYPAAPDGSADWLMVGEVPGEGIVVVPLAKPKSGDRARARPIGIYRASQALRREYRRDR